MGSSAGGPSQGGSQGPEKAAGSWGQELGAGLAPPPSQPLLVSRNPPSLSSRVNLVAKLAFRYH